MKPINLSEKLSRFKDHWHPRQIAVVDQMQVLLADDRPYIPLFHPQVMDMWRDNVILPFLPDLDGISGAGGVQTDARVLTK